jgi:death-on-curing protein
MEPRFLSLGEVVRIHRNQLDLYGGEPGIRDMDALQSALAAPQATFDGRFLHEDLIEMAAAYLFHIVQNHAFIDGNKRTGVVAALVFLALNGFYFSAGEDAVEEIVMKITNGKTDKKDLAGFFRRYTRPGNI